MAKWILLLTLVPAFAFVANVQSASVQSTNLQITQTPTPCIPRKCVFVNTTLTTGNEDGSTAMPYSQVAEGRAWAEAQASGGDVYQWNGTGWSFVGTYPEVTIAAGGVSIAEIVVYVILAVLALVLIIVGRRLQQRSQQLRK